MEQYRSRRALLATLSLGVIAGCLSSLDDTDEDEDTDEECDLASGQWQGEGEPIITRAGLILSEIIICHYYLLQR